MNMYKNIREARTAIKIKHNLKHYNNIKFEALSSENIDYVKRNYRILETVVVNNIE